MFTGVAEDSPAPPYYDYPFKLKDVHKGKPQDQERAVHPILQPNPSYKPLEVCVCVCEVKDTHKMKSEEQERGVDPILQPNPSYEPLQVCMCALEVKDAHKKSCMHGIETQMTSVESDYKMQSIYEQLTIFKRVQLN